MLSILLGLFETKHIAAPSEQARDSVDTIVKNFVADIFNRVVDRYATEANDSMIVLFTGAYGRNGFEIPFF